MLNKIYFPSLTPHMALSLYIIHWRTEDQGLFLETYSSIPQIRKQPGATWKLREWNWPRKDTEITPDSSFRNLCKRWALEAFQEVTLGIHRSTYLNQLLWHLPSLWDPQLQRTMDFNFLFCQRDKGALISWKRIRSCIGVLGRGEGAQPLWS